METKPFKLSVFEGQTIRKTWHKDEWYFSVVDIVGLLSGSKDHRNYWKVLKFRLIEESGNETVTNCNQLKLPAEDRNLYILVVHNWYIWFKKETIWN